MRIKMIRLLCLVLLLAMGLASCKKPDPDKQVVLDVEETAYDLAVAAGFETTYNAADSFLTKNYGFDPETVTAYKALFGTMLDANRLLLFQVEGDQNKKSVRAVAEKLKEELSTSFPQEMTQQLEQAKEAQIIDRGNYVLFISGSGAQAGVDAFQALFDQPGATETP